MSCSQILWVSNVDKVPWEWVVSVLWYLGLSWDDLKLSSVGTCEQNIHPWSLHMAWASSQHGGLWALWLIPWWLMVQTGSVPANKAGTLWHFMRWHWESHSIISTTVREVTSLPQFKGRRHRVEPIFWRQEELWSFLACVPFWTITKPREMVPHCQIFGWWPGPGRWFNDPWEFPESLLKGNENKRGKLTLELESSADRGSQPYDSVLSMSTPCATALRKFCVWVCTSCMPCKEAIQGSVCISLLERAVQWGRQTESEEGGET